MNKVTLVGITKPVNQTIDSAEDLVAYVARVSNPSNQSNTGTSRKLLKYLVDNKHWSPFEMVNVLMEIETTRDIGRQILRHRSFTFQEFSQRYANVDSIQTEISREPRFQDHKNRQNSLEVDYNNDEQRQVAYQWEILQENLVKQTKEVYDWAISKGIAKEQARAVLPEGLTMSRLYMSGSLRSWIHYCQLRMDKATQKEHREVAVMAWKLLVNEFPAIAELTGS